MIELQHASVHYGQALALKNIGLRAAQDEIVAIVGRNGAGKSTVLKTLIGLRPLSAGNRLIAGQDATRRAVEQISRDGIALVPDTRRIFPNLTVRENLRMGALAHQPGYWTQDRVLQVFPRLGERIGFHGDQLSGGEQQMLSIARALLGNPRVLLLDEPTEGLAPRIVNELIEVFAEVHRQGTGIVLVEQNLKVPARLAHRQYVLDHGEIAWSGSAAEVQADRHIIESILTTGIQA
ncbi:High-affinity branched-chain amino acid transport ATP-binding protein LivF [Achromobacter aegrifaciens]|uniref:ABC transporter ATP-binding protein n=1 Tax=Achromobacter aegrifaciens TaxID=1287736 RepID=UPI001465C3A8|nr:ABC transporter ATP-binding protein [Achromobacter aegrifaciens]CAB3913174.1 High-affinity branched-chain amino acid transport ATP-binding protein LivF [Achromobacter aegrifaciens]